MYRREEEQHILDGLGDLRDKVRYLNARRRHYSDMYDIAYNVTLNAADVHYFAESIRRVDEHIGDIIVGAE